MRAFLLATLLATALPLSLRGQDTTVAVRPPSLARTPEGVELNFQDADVRGVLGALADVAGLNVVYSSIPQRTVTLRTSRPIAVSEARAYLETVVRSNGLTLTEEGGLIRISGDAAPAPPVALRGAASGRAQSQRLFVYRLNHAKADVLAATLADLFGISRSAFAGDGESGTLSEELRAQRIQFGGVVQEPAAPPPARRGEQPGAERGGSGLAAGLEGPVQVVPDPSTNSLLIRAVEPDYRTIRAAVEQLDVRPLQVMIEVLIAEVRRDWQVGVGTNTSISQQTLGEGRTSIGGALIGSSAGDLAVRVLGLGGVRADVLLGALATSGEVTILSRPLLLAQNNQEARILVGSERPFIQLFRALPTDGAVRDQVVQYRDVGTQLTIRPTINPDGYVTMSVLQEVSTATSEVQFGAPVISTREARTQLLVKDGLTAVIGGLVDHQAEKAVSGIPFLMDIPVIGGLFRSSRSRRRNATELFLFLTPHVLRTDEDMDNAMRQLRDATPRIRDATEESIPLLPLREPVVTPTSLPGTTP